jgi:hypothetical protein
VRGASAAYLDGETATRSGVGPERKDRDIVERSTFVGESEIHGTGVFTRRAIRKGERAFVCGGRAVAAGDVPEDARAMQIGPETYLVEDPADPGRDDFLNHSCDPNLGFVTGEPVLYALRDIGAGEELFFDYSTTMGEPGWSLPCRCGAENCRGAITSFCDLPEAEQRRIEPIALAYLRRG